MIKKRKGSAKAAIGQQRAWTKRNAPGKRFIGDDADAQQARQAELAKVHQMQMAARAAAERARELQTEELSRDERSRLRAARHLVRDTARLAGTLARLPLRMATAAASVPLRFVSAMLLHPREA